MGSQKRCWSRGGTCGSTRSWTSQWAVQAGHPARAKQKQRKGSERVAQRFFFFLDGRPKKRERRLAPPSTLWCELFTSCTKQRGWRWSVADTRLGASFARSTAVSQHFDADIVVRVHQPASGDLDALFKAGKLQALAKAWLRERLGSCVSFDESVFLFLKTEYRHNDGTQVQLDILFKQVDGDEEKAKVALTTSVATH